ncbi:hypothetical protein V3C99_010288 [Haemonchus contortus]
MFFYVLLILLILDAQTRRIRRCMDQFPVERCLLHKKVGDCKYTETWQYLMKIKCAKTCGFCIILRKELPPNPLRSPTRTPPPRAPPRAPPQTPPRAPPRTPPPSPSPTPSRSLPQNRSGTSLVIKNKNGTA